MGVLALLLVAIGGTVAAYVMDERWPAAVAVAAAALALVMLVLPRGRRSVSSGHEGRDGGAESADRPDVVEAAGAEGEPAPQAEPDVVGASEVRVHDELGAPSGVTAAEAAEQAMVVVVPGRRRYHRSDCALVADLDVEEIHMEEARAEGFTACSSCR